MDAPNFLNVLTLTERSAIIKELIELGRLKVVGAMYDVSTGKVTFYRQN
jgi:carbonic anhydrase